MEAKISVNEFVDPNLGRMVAIASVGCVNCAYVGRHCPSVLDGTPHCTASVRDPGFDIIWVRAEDATQAPKAVKLTGEQINEIEVASWSGPGFGAKFNREAFARAIEAEVLKANGLGDQQ